MNIKEVLALHKEFLETSGVKGERADLRSANLSSANLSSANLRSADLSSADLSYVNLYSADLSYADLSYADLSSADLSSANLSYADLSYADLSSADLRCANLIFSHFWKWNLYATSKTLRIGCEQHEWKVWEEKGEAMARSHDGLDCAKAFKAYWPILEAMRKNLIKRFPEKKVPK